MVKLSFKDKIGYGLASFGDAAAYSITCTFLLFFLTTVAGIGPAMAGTIIIIGTVIDAILNSVMGYISDNISTKWGRRVPFLFLFGSLLFISVTLLFTSFNMIYPLKVCYYIVMVAVFYLAYTGFFIPYLAMGAEFTSDYKERTALRSFAAFFNMLGSLVSMVVPSAAVSLLCSFGFKDNIAWSLTVGTIGFVASLSVFATAICARKFDRSELWNKQNQLNKENGIKTPPVIIGQLSLISMVRQYWQVLKLKPIKWLLLTSLFFLIAYGMLLSDLLYFLNYNLGFSGSQVSAVLLYRCIVGIVLIPFINKLCAVTDKKSALIIVQLACAIVIASYKLLGVSSELSLYIFVFFLGTATVTYWQIMPAIIYDVCEYDQLKTGQRRQGTIVSIQGLVEAASVGIGTQLLGIFLEFGKFDGDAKIQSDSALVWIENCTTFIPAIALVISCITLYKYPITRQVYADIIEKLNKK